MTDTDEDGDAGDAGDDANDARSDDPITFVEARERAMDLTDQLIDHPLDSVVRMERRDDGGFRTLVEVVERSAVPDTQDILGRYEIVLDERGRMQEYGLVERYRRGESREEIQ